MKKRFNLLCVIMLIALVFITAVPMLGAFGSGFLQGFNASEMKETKIEGVVTNVGLLPKGSPMKFTHEIKNEKTGQMEKVQINVATINAPKENRRDHTLFNFAMPVLGILSCIVVITIFTIFVKIILSVNRNEIFDARMEKRLGCCGALLILHYVNTGFISLGNYLHNVSLYQFTDYIVSFPAYPSGTVLLAGIGMLLIGQIFRIARQLKEEQELTI